MPWDGFKPSTRDKASRAKDPLFTNADKFKTGAECS